MTMERDAPGNGPRWELSAQEGAGDDMVAAYAWREGTGSASRHTYLLEVRSRLLQVFEIPRPPPLRGDGGAEVPKPPARACCLEVHQPAQAEQAVVDFINGGKSEGEGPARLEAAAALGLLIENGPLPEDLIDASSPRRAGPDAVDPSATELLSARQKHMALLAPWANVGLLRGLAGEAAFRDAVTQGEADAVTGARKRYLAFLLDFESYGMSATLRHRRGLPCLLDPRRTRGDAPAAWVHADELERTYSGWTHWDSVDGRLAGELALALRDSLNLRRYVGFVASVSEQERAEIPGATAGRSSEQGGKGPPSWGTILLKHCAQFPCYLGLVAGLTALLLPLALGGPTGEMHLNLFSHPMHERQADSLGGDGEAGSGSSGAKLATINDGREAESRLVLAEVLGELGPKATFRDWLARPVLDWSGPVEAFARVAYFTVVTTLAPGVGLLWLLVTASRIKRGWREQSPQSSIITLLLTDAAQLRHSLGCLTLWVGSFTLGLKGLRVFTLSTCSWWVTAWLCTSASAVLIWLEAHRHTLMRPVRRSGAATMALHLLGLSFAMGLVANVFWVDQHVRLALATIGERPGMLQTAEIYFKMFARTTPPMDRFIAQAALVSLVSTIAYAVLQNAKVFGRRGA